VYRKKTLKSIKNTLKPAVHYFFEKVVDKNEIGSVSGNPYTPLKRNKILESRIRKKKF
jgi:hypothetical protein